MQGRRKLHGAVKVGGIELVNCEKGGVVFKVSRSKSLFRNAGGEGETKLHKAVIGFFVHPSIQSIPRCIGCGL